MMCRLINGAGQQLVNWPFWRTSYWSIDAPNGRSRGEATRLLISTLCSHLCVLAFIRWSPSKLARVSRLSLIGGSFSMVRICRSGRLADRLRGPGSGANRVAKPACGTTCLACWFPIFSFSDFFVLHHLDFFAASPGESSLVNSGFIFNAGRHRSAANQYRSILPKNGGFDFHQGNVWSHIRRKNLQNQTLESCHRRMV